MAEADFRRRRGAVVTVDGAHFLVGVDRLLRGLVRSTALHRVMLRRPAVFVLFGVLGAAMVCAAYFALDISNGFSREQAWQRRGFLLAGVGAVILVLGLLFAAWQWLGLWRALRNARAIGAIAPWTIELWWGPEGIGWREGRGEGLVPMAEVTAGRKKVRCCSYIIAAIRSCRCLSTN